jgi:hypothetical protein
MDGSLDAEVIWYGAEEQPAPKRWRSKEAKEIVAAVQRAGGQVERTASGHLKVTGPTGSAIVASATASRTSRRLAPRSSSSTEFVTRVPSGTASRA